jgi:hypothetical protein
LELITRTCEPSQSHPLEVMMNLEVRKPHLDLLALIARCDHFRCHHYDAFVSRALHHRPSQWGDPPLQKFIEHVNA